MGTGTGTATDPAAAAVAVHTVAVANAANAEPEPPVVVASWHRPQNCCRRHHSLATPSKRHLPNNTPDFVVAADPVPQQVIAAAVHTPAVADRWCWRLPRPAVGRVFLVLAVVAVVVAAAVAIAVPSLSMPLVCPMLPV